MDSKEHRYALRLLFEHLSPSDFIMLRGVCASLSLHINEIVGKSAKCVFRIPYGEKITTLIPHSIIIYSSKSIHKASSSVEVNFFNNKHLKQCIECLPSNLNELQVKHALLEGNKLPANLVACGDTPWFMEKYQPSSVLMDCSSLPRSLKKLTLPQILSSPLRNLPPNLTHLTAVGRDTAYLPSSITHLVTKFYFNEPVDTLPASLTHLVLPHSFNQPVDRLPPTLIELTIKSHGDSSDFRETYQHRLDNLPRSLRKLTLENYDKPLSKLPNGLLHLTVGNIFNQEVDKLPAALTHLVLGDDFDKPVDTLPPGLTYLTLGSSFNQPVRQLPPKLLQFTSGDAFDQLVDTLPATLTHLTTAYCFNQSVDHLPSALTHLTVGHEFNHAVDHLPSKLQFLEMGYSFNQHVDHLPHLLLKFISGYSFNKSVAQLPPNLSHLITGDCFNQPVDKLPPSLSLLTTGEGFQHSTANLLHTVQHNRVPELPTIVYWCPHPT